LHKNNKFWAFLNPKKYRYWYKNRLVAPEWCCNDPCLYRVNWRLPGI